MTNRETMQQALEALEEYVNVVVSVNDPNEWTPKVADAGSPARKAITALREALAQDKLRGLENLLEESITALREALAQEHAMHELSRLGQEIEQEPTPWPISTNAAMRDARLNVGWGSEQQQQQAAVDLQTHIDNFEGEES